MHAHALTSIINIVVHSSHIQLHRELTLITGKEKTHNFLEDWPNWLRKIISYGLLEAQTRTTVKTVLTGYDELEESDGMCVCNQ